MPARPSPFTDFAARLETAFDRTGISAGRSRVTKVANEFGVSRETARLWFAGSAMPELPRLIEIAQFCHVGLEWLATGRGTSMPVVDMVRDDPESSAYVAGLSADERAVVAAMRNLHPQRRRGLVDLLT